MNGKFDTIRLRALHTKCLSVCEIAEAMGTVPTIIEMELKKLGYTPIYTKDKPEPDKLLSEIKKSLYRRPPAQALRERKTKRLYVKYTTKSDFCQAGFAVDCT